MKIDRTKLTELERAAWAAAFEHALALRCELGSIPQAARQRMQFGKTVLLTFNEPDVGDAKSAAAWADQVVAAMRIALALNAEAP